MKFTTIFFYVLLCGITVHAQRGNSWVFGYNAGLSFSNGTPTPFTESQMLQLEGSSSISDLQGHLLFYSDGVKVWNAHHQVMPNGTNLKGHFSSTQSSMIVPSPDDPDRYYLFTVDQVGGPNGLCYSVINMQLDGGLGDVEIKNIFLSGPTNEKITSVNHCNGKDVWVVTAINNSDAYYAYLVTAAGVGPPVISHSGRTSPFGSIGYLKFSPDGTKLASANYSVGLDLFDFNSMTGELTNRKAIIDDRNQLPYGVEFSPNSKLLYATNAIYNPVLNVFRYDLSQYQHLDADIATIVSSRTELGFGTVNFITNNFAALQLAPDRKLYMAVFLNGDLGVINQPDVPGTGCQFILNGLTIPAPGKCNYGLPDFNQSYFKGSFTFDVPCTTNDAQFYFDRSTKARAVEWNFGDPSSGTANIATIDSPFHNYPRPGAYQVQLVEYFDCRNDTFTRTVHVGAVQFNLGPDQEKCSPATYLIDPHFPTSYQYTWQDNATTPNYLATNSGLYWVQITNPDNGCYHRDSINVTFYSPPVVDLGIDRELCEKTSLVLDPGFNAGAQYTWQDNSHSPVFTVNKGGTYWVRAAIADCIATDTIHIRTRYLPRVWLGNDTALCPGMKIELNPVLSHSENAVYHWNTGIATPAITITAPGEYALIASNDCGSMGDAIIVKPGVCALFVPTAFSPNNDGLNDVFKPGYGENVTTYAMEIFNRWGVKVFSSDELSKGWDGRLNGVQQPVGVYTWFIKYRVFNSSTEYRQKGTVTVVY